MEGYLRGELAKRAGINAETLRYYEKQGILPEPYRTEAGYRLYSEEALARLTFVRNAKLCGFTLKEIRKALVKSEGGSRIKLEDFISLIDRKTASLDREIAQREKTKAALAGLKANLQAAERHPGVQEVLRHLHMDS